MGLGDTLARRRSNPDAWAMARLSVFAFLLSGVLACSTSPLETRPFDVTIAAGSTTAAPGDTIIFVVDAQGRSLLGIEINYGDTNSDLFGASGAQTARVTFRHAYLQPGTYLVRARATDAAAGEKEASVEVCVN